MRYYSPAVKSLLGLDNISIFYLVSITRNNLSLRHTSLPFDITIPGLDTFYTGNGLLGVDSPKLSAVVDREAYKIVYVDPAFEFSSKFEMGKKAQLSSTIVDRPGLLSPSNPLGFNIHLIAMPMESRFWSVKKTSLRVPITLLYDRFKQGFVKNVKP